MNNNLIICIGRQYGSGGREIGEKLAAELGIPCYGNEILQRAATDNGIVFDLFKKADEQPTDSFLYSLSLGSHNTGVGMLGFSDYLTNDNIFIMTSKAITDMAAEGPCVFIGRCADYVLQDLPNVTSVFIHADNKCSVKRIMEKNGIEEKVAVNLIKRTNKKRAGYYNFYSEKSWSSCASYDISISSTRFGINGVVEILTKYAKSFDIL